MFRNALFVLSAWFAAGFLVAGTARAQDPLPTPTPIESPAVDPELGEAGPAVAALSQLSPKLVAFVFDTSGSMKGENLRRARSATITLLRRAIKPGDRVVLYTFGSSYEKVFDQTVTSAADARKLIELVPSKPGDGAGTNIRRPHHEALKLAEATLPNPSAIVLLTDSFNDTPNQTDPAFSDYVRYYIPGDRLDKYPKTPENQDYERLLAKMRQEKLQLFGIGVQIDSSGRPVERLPKAAPSVEPTPEPEQTGPVDVSAKNKDGGNPALWISLLAAGISLGTVFGVLAARNKPTPIRISGGPGGARDFSVGATGIRLGGDGASAVGDGYPIAGVKSPAALIVKKAGALQIAPGPQPDPSVRVFHNGAPLETASPLRFGDEVRVSVSSAGKDYRLRIQDPTRPE